MIFVFEPECDQRFCNSEKTRLLLRKKLKQIRTIIVQLTLCIHRQFKFAGLKKKFTDMPPLNSMSDKPCCPKEHEGLIINYAKPMRTL